MSARPALDLDTAIDAPSARSGDHCFTLALDRLRGDPTRMNQKEQDRAKDKSEFQPPDHCTPPCRPSPSERLGSASRPLLAAGPDSDASIEACEVQDAAYRSKGIVSDDTVLVLILAKCPLYILRLLPIL